MLDRDQSPAFRTLPGSARKLLTTIEELVAGRPYADITYSDLAAHGANLPSIRHALRLIRQLGFIRTETGERRANRYILVEDWRAIDVDEAKRRRELARQPRPTRQASRKPKPVVKPVSRPVGRPPSVSDEERPTPSLPVLKFMEGWQE